MNISKSFVDFCNVWKLDVPMITEEHLKRGTKIGKLLRREITKADVMFQDVKNRTYLDSITQEGVLAWNARQYVSRIIIGHGEELIRHLYDEVPIRSCMTGEGHKFAEFYAKNDISVAYMVNEHGEITARCLVAETGYSDLYGDTCSEMEMALQELGMEKMEQLFKPDTLLKIPSKYLPYLDNWNHVLVKVDDHTLLATGITNIDLEDKPNTEFVEMTIEQLEELMEDGYQWIVTPNKMAHPIDNGVHYEVTEASETPIQLVIDQLQEYIDEDVANEIKPEISSYWNQLRINGRLFWHFEQWSYGRGWVEPYRLIMDDYGMGRTVRYNAGDNPVRQMIYLGEYGYF